jgi:enoyl-CoA hydratase/carnithine racemase
VALFENIQLDLGFEPGIARILMNRPEHRNPMSIKTAEEVRQAFETIRGDDTVRVVIVTGTGNSFVAGADTEFFLETESVFDNANFLKTLHRTFNMAETLPQPVIAAVNGYAIGAGAEFVAACDFAIAAESAKFSMPECIMNMVSNIQAALFPYYMPIGQVREWMYTGDMMPASEAARLGLVNRAVPDDQLVEEVLTVARKIASYPPMGVQFQKELINQRWLRTDLDTAMMDGIHYSALAHTTGVAKTMVKEAIAKRKARSEERKRREERD